jgi:pyrroline-5-carboxylate reductase
VVTGRSPDLQEVSMGAALAFIGAGRMGEALIAGAIHGGTAPSDIVIVEPAGVRSAFMRDTYGVVVGDLAAAGAADLVILAVKPDQVVGVCHDLAAHLAASTLVVSIAAGVSTATMEAALPDGTAVVRVMPNTPAFVGQGMSVMSAGSGATEADLDRAQTVLESVGRVLRLPESKQDAVTAVSGSGPAYVFYLVEAMIEAGVQLGLTRDVARELAVQTALGAGTLMATSGEHPVVLRENVMSPGGTTATAIRELEAHGVRGAVYAALDACARRSAELSA